jgi:hypothetical protein
VNCSPGMMFLQRLSERVCCRIKVFTVVRDTVTFLSPETFLRPNLNLCLLRIELRQIPHNLLVRLVRPLCTEYKYDVKRQPRFGKKRKPHNYLVLLDPNHFTEEERRLLVHRAEHRYTVQHNAGSLLLPTLLQTVEWLTWKGPGV